jgi:predicted adenylyl cyclase CyaB
MPVNIEVKARCPDTARVRAVLVETGARLIGVDRQTDTYFDVPSGRLKLRQGDIENHLIYYNRPDEEDAKRSDIDLYQPADRDTLSRLLAHALGVRCEVRKRREIYLHGRVKIHVDQVDGLGEFVEIEVIEHSSTPDESEMKTECAMWMKKLGIRREDLVASSYSDMTGKQN